MQDTPDLDTAQILIVDDDQSSRRSLALILQGQGFEVDTAASGQQALTKAEASPYHAVLLDIRLPDIAGLDLIQPLKERHPDLAVVMVTAFASLDTAIQAMNQGASAYVTKPLNIDQVLMTIRQAIERQRLVIENRALLEAAQRELAERKRAQAAHQLLASALEQAAEAVIIVDTEGIIQYVNPAFEWITGYPDQETLGQSHRVLEERTPNAAPYQEMWAALNDGDTWRGRLRGLKKDGALYTAEATAFAVRDPAGEVSNYVILHHDVSEQVRLEAQLRQAQKMEAIGQLAGAIAHDFNNLLTAIQGYAEIVLESLPQVDPLRNDIQEIQKAGDRAASLTGQLLAFSRRQVLQPRPLNLNELIEGMKGMLQRLIGEDIAFSLDLDPGLVQVKADWGQIEQVVMNLVVNARDAMPSGGKLSISTHMARVDEDKVEHSADAYPGLFARLTVMDAGSGMDDETLLRIFEPFFTTKEHGTGLGLAVVYGTIRQHDGWIAVDSTPGQGTAFHIYLPTAPRAVAAGPENARAAGTPGGRGETILLVEDDERVRHFANRVLGSHGYVVFEADSAEEALEVFEREQEQIRLLFSDVILSGQTGLQLVDRLRAASPNLCVLLSSGYSDKKSRWQEINARNLHYLQKPYGINDLLRAVQDALDAGG